MGSQVHSGDVSRGAPPGCTPLRCYNGYAALMADMVDRGAGIMRAFVSTRPRSV